MSLPVVVLKGSDPVLLDRAVSDCVDALLGGGDHAELVDQFDGDEYECGALVMAGMSVSFGLGAPPEGLGLGDGSATDVDGAEQKGRIGSVITGTTGDDVIHGTPFDDQLSGGAGNDTIFGHEGDDLLDGGAGDDQLLGGPGDDRLLGGSGNDGSAVECSALACRCTGK